MRGIQLVALCNLITGCLLLLHNRNELLHIFGDGKNVEQKPGKNDKILAFQDHEQTARSLTQKYIYTIMLCALLFYIIMFVFPVYILTK